MLVNRAILSSGPNHCMIGQALYGRDWETRMVFNLLLSKRLVLLHSPSGAGKTSLIHAGLWPRLEVTFRVRPPIQTRCHARFERHFN